MNNLMDLAKATMELTAIVLWFGMIFVVAGVLAGVL
jgi:hypothetical protein